MDRGIPTEEILQEMRDPAREIFYLVGTPKGKIRQYEKKWLDLPWQQVRESVDVKLFEQDGELYVLAKSEGRRAKETAMRPQAAGSLAQKTPGHAAQPALSGPTANAFGCHEISIGPRLPVRADASTGGRPTGRA